jgi:CMP-2-keto-3-deoxyoctulosonic acid synthetase
LRHVAAIIPARYGAVRFPGKLVADLARIHAVAGTAMRPERRRSLAERDAGGAGLAPGRDERESEW